MKREEILVLTREAGFDAAAFMKTDELVIRPEYRKFCEMDLCKCYNANPACPPKCGTVDEMTERIRIYKYVLVLQTVCDSAFKDDPVGARGAKRVHNEKADQLEKKLCKAGITSILRMSAGPWKGVSCMSAYCIDAQKMADAVDMVCWADDGKSRFFSQMLFDEKEVSN